MKNKLNLHNGQDASDWQHHPLHRRQTRRADGLLEEVRRWQGPDEDHQDLPLQQARGQGQHRGDVRQNTRPLFIVECLFVAQLRLSSEVKRLLFV